MRDLGLPALVEKYPEPLFANGIFPADYTDMYRQWHIDIANGKKSIEGIIPLTKDRIPFHLRYTTSFDKHGNPVKAYGSATMVVNSDKEAELREIINSLGYQFGNVYKIDIDT